MSLTKDQFLKEVADHRLTILREDDVYRHLRFSRPDTSCMRFDLITWPGYLCYCGDMGTFVFKRTHDMLDFFRPSERAAEDPFRGIDRRYWQGKLEGIDRSGVTEFDPCAFRREITVQRRKLLVRYGRDMAVSQRWELWCDLGELRDKAHDGESLAMQAVFNWNHWFLHQRRVRKDICLDTSEFPDCKRWTPRFEWCCFALRWAVMTYDAAKVSDAKGGAA
jgi:hypothetical protein